MLFPSWGRVHRQVSNCQAAILLEPHIVRGATFRTRRRASAVVDTSGTFDGERKAEVSKYSVRSIGTAGFAKVEMRVKFRRRKRNGVKDLIGVMIETSVDIYARFQDSK